VDSLEERYKMQHFLMTVSGLEKLIKQKGTNLELLVLPPSVLEHTFMRIIEINLKDAAIVSTRCSSWLAPQDIPKQWSEVGSSCGSVLKNTLSAAKVLSGITRDRTGVPR
jgi:hypothetical protein